MLEEFLDMTQRIIERDGFDGHHPTLVLPGRREVIVLEGNLNGDDHEAAAYQLVAKHVAAQEDYLVAFKNGADRFKVFGRIGGVPQRRICRVAGA